jgi:hypothetical protein
MQKSAMQKDERTEHRVQNSVARMKTIAFILAPEF